MKKPTKHSALEGTICDKDSHDAPSISRLYHCKRICQFSVNTRRPCSGICIFLANLIDVYRKLHPKNKSYTYESKPLKLKSRRDFFLISGKFQPDITKVETRASIAPDHKAVFLSMNLNEEFKRGPGLWKFNNTLLQDESYLQLIKDYYPCVLQKYAEVNNKQLLWELIKMEIRSETIRYSKGKSKQSKMRESIIQSRIEELE